MTDIEKVVGAFSEDQAVRLTGVSKSQLRYWDKSGLYSPSYADDNRRLSFSRVYSFKDIAALRVLNALRNQYSVPLQHLRKVGPRLGGLPSDRWIGTKLYVLNKKVVWQEPGTGRPQEIVAQQYVVPVVIEDVIAQTKRDAIDLGSRTESQHGKVDKRRHVRQNSAVIAGTRIPVQAIKRFSAAGYSVDQIIAEYPDLNERDIAAALDYAAPRAAA